MRKILIVPLYAALLVLTSACTDTRDLNVTPAAHVTEVAEAAPATAAHFTNNYATWACGATRQTEEHVLQHAHPVALTPTYVRGSCQSQAEDVQCFWDAILWWNGATSIAGGQDAVSCVVLP